MFFPDLRFAFQQLTKNPGFAAVAILTLGIGACTAIFLVINSALLLATVAFAARLLPARRAIRVNPIEALRAE